MGRVVTNKDHPLAFLGNNFSFKKGGVITHPMGQWAYPGQVTRIPSNRITMQGVNYPVLGVDNTGYKQYMLPGGEYTYPGTYVTEYPMIPSAQNGLGRYIPQRDATQVPFVMRWSPEEARRREEVEKQKRIAEKQKEVASGKGSESFFGIPIPVDYDNLERANASTIARKSVSAEDVRPEIYNNMIQAALMAAGPISGIGKGAKMASFPGKTKVIPKNPSIYIGETRGSYDDVARVSTSERMRLGPKEATTVYEGNWFPNRNHPMVTYHDYQSGISPEWFYKRSIDNWVNQAKQTLVHPPGLSQIESKLPDPRYFITSTPMKYKDVVYNKPSRLAAQGALKFRDPSLFLKDKTNNVQKMVDMFKEAPRFAGSEARKIMHVNFTDLYNDSPFKMGGSRKRCKCEE